MTTFQTEFSSTSSLPKKLQKSLTSSFPFLPPDDSQIQSMDLCGQIVPKKDAGNSIKFCPICDRPMIVKTQNFPCEHVTCNECAKPKGENCFVCGAKVEKRGRIGDMAKTYECEVQDCLKMFESEEKLIMHKYGEHQIMSEGMNFGMLNMGVVGNNLAVMGMNNMQNYMIYKQ